MHQRFACLAFLLLARFLVSAEPPAGYYTAAQGKLGADLRTALHTIIHNHHSLPYSGSPHPNTSDAFLVLDHDPANTNNIYGIYSHYSIPWTSIGSAAGNWNREHLWCASYGTSSGPPHTDLHHMRPESAPVNSARENYYFDVSNPAAPLYTRYSNSAAGTIWSSTSTTWEPSDAAKGEVARSLLYMTIRYTGDTTGEPKLTLTDATNLIVSGSTYMGRYTTLLKWHFTFPVTPAESNRNDQVYGLYQANRNPFVDHPEWVAAAFIPPLRITAAGTNVTLTWTNDYNPAMLVAASTNVFGPWQTLTNAPKLTNSTWRILFPAPGPARFFRLQLQ